MAPWVIESQLYRRVVQLYSVIDWGAKGFQPIISLPLCHLYLSIRMYNCSRRYKFPEWTEKKARRRKSKSTLTIDDDTPLNGGRETRSIVKRKCHPLFSILQGHSMVWSRARVSVKCLNLMLLPDRYVILNCFTLNTIERIMASITRIIVYLSTLIMLFKRSLLGISLQFFTQSHTSLHLKFL